MAALYAGAAVRHDGRHSMRIYLKHNVLEAAQARVSWLFDEFAQVAVNMSGGKDSCVVFNLVLAEARRRNALPVTVIWFDQEAEWQGTVDYMTAIMTRPDVRPLWFQVPFTMPNSTSTTLPEWTVWDPEHQDRWVHPQHPLSIKDNRWPHIDLSVPSTVPLSSYLPTNACVVGGVRAEESPSRAMGLTSFATYKWATWGTKPPRGSSIYNFYPIYDWSYKDVWKYIHEIGASYNRIYDQQYQMGYAIQDMRVSSLSHENSGKHLLVLQEIERETWNRLVRRLPSINSVKHLKNTTLNCPDELPPMFESWPEYRDFLVEKLVSDPEIRARYLHKFRHLAEKYAGMKRQDLRHRVEIKSILASDHQFFVKLHNWEDSPMVGTYRKWKRGDYVLPDRLASNPYMNG